MWFVSDVGENRVGYSIFTKEKIKNYKNFYRFILIIKHYTFNVL